MVPSINQYPIVNVELSCFFEVEGTSFVLDMLEGIVYLFVHCCHSISPFFGCGRGEFVVIIKVYGSRVETTETSIRGEFVGSGCCGVVGKFGERQPCSPAVLPIVAVYAEILLECLDCAFAESVSLRVVGGGEA